MIACAPHSTFVDSLYIFYAYGCPSGIGKREAFQAPLMGVFVRAMQFVAVDRNTADGKKAALEQLKERAMDPSGRQFMAFAEGTCHNRKQLIQLKKGVFTPGLPVQAVVLEFPYWFFDPTWSSCGPSRAFMIYWLLCQFWSRMRVTFLPPHAPSEAEKSDAVLFADNVRGEMASALGNVAVTQHSYGDMFLGKAAKKRGMSPQALNFELAVLKDAYGVDEATARHVVLSFGRAFGRHGEPVGNAPALARACGVEETAVGALFEALQVNGHVDMASLVVASAKLQHVLDDEVVGTLWNEMAGSKDGLSMDDVHRALPGFFPAKSRARRLKTFLEVTQGAQSLTKERFAAYLRAKPVMALAAVECELKARELIAAEV